jgi:pilus assembly protein TadC
VSWLLAVATWAMAGLLILSEPRPAPRRRSLRPPQLPHVAPERLARPAAAAAAGAIAVLWHPGIGLVAGFLLWWLLPAVVERLDRSSEVRHREALERQLPLAAGLLAACLAAGATLPRSLRVTADAVGDPARSLLQRAAGASELGAPPSEIAAILAGPGSASWRGVGAAVLRSAASGAPLAELLGVQADQALHTWSADAAARARAAAVRSVMPLALCYLPAFLLLGVGPVVAGLLGAVGFP